MKIHDISITVTPETVTWNGSERGLTVEFLSQIGPDSVATVSAQSFGSHTGTHLDAPLHFVAGGGTVDKLDLDALIGAVEVVEIAGDVISAESLENAGIPADAKRIIFKTQNTARGYMRDKEFHKDYVGVAPDAAKWLTGRGFTTVGVDYLSVGPYSGDNVITHQTLLGAGVVAVEGLDLTGITPGRYFLTVLPPKIGGVEGSPCRAVLIEGLI